MRSPWPGICRALLLAFAVFATGCQPPVDEVVDTSPKSTRSISEGKLNETLVGSWLMDDHGNRSTMTLKSDLTYEIVSKIQSQGGPQDSTVAGKWSNKDKELIMERVGPDGKPFTIVYEWSLKGKELELGNRGKKVKYKYTRQ